MTEFGNSKMAKIGEQFDRTPVVIPSSEPQCRCGHLESEHDKGDCLYVYKNGRFCKCDSFKERK